jgi:hypothetical protein
MKAKLLTQLYLRLTNTIKMVFASQALPILEFGLQSQKGKLDHLLLRTNFTYGDYRKTLKIVDQNNNLILLLVPHASDCLYEKFDILPSELQALFPGELYHTTSRVDDEFLALHFSWYNRYYESVSFLLLSYSNYCPNIYFWKGKGAPIDASACSIAKVGKLVINWGQRAPREAKEIRENSDRYEVVKDILGDILQFSHDNVSFCAVLCFY